MVVRRLGVRRVRLVRGVHLVVVRPASPRESRAASAAQGQRLRDFPEIEQVEVTLTEMVSFGPSLVGIPLRGLDPDGA